MKCSFCNAEIPRGSKACPVCRNKIDLRGLDEERTEQRKLSKGKKIMSISSKGQSTSSGDSSNYYNAHISNKVFITSIIAFAAAIYIGFIGFSAIRNPAEGMSRYIVYFAGFIISTAFTGFSIYKLIHLFMSKYVDAKAVFSALLCIIALILLINNFTSLGEKVDNFQYIKSAYNEDSIQAQRQQNEHDRRVNDAINAINNR